jgi:hypothetical protein
MDGLAVMSERNTFQYVPEKVDGPVHRESLSNPRSQLAEHCVERLTIDVLHDNQVFAPDSMTSYTWTMFVYELCVFSCFFEDFGELFVRRRDALQETLEGLHHDFRCLSEAFKRTRTPCRLRRRE